MDLEIKNYRPKANHWRTLTLVGGDWLIIAASIFCSQFYPENWAIYLASIILIASRQHALFAVVHEGAHFNLSRNKKWNDLISNLFAAWPMGLSTVRYRAHHWKHHNHTNTDLDPDWNRKVSHPNWQFPRSKISFFRLYLPYFLGGGIVEWFFILKLVGARGKELLRVAPLLTVAITAAFYLKIQIQLIQYWLIPLFLILPFLSRMRSIAEHLGTPNKSPLNASRNIANSPIEAFFFGPHNTCYHLVHHLYPHAPWHQLPEIHRNLKNSSQYISEAHECDGYFIGKKSAFKELTTFQNLKTTEGKNNHAKRIAA